MHYGRYPTHQELKQLAGYIYPVTPSSHSTEAALDRWQYLQRSTITVLQVGTQKVMAVQWASNARLCEVFTWTEQGKLECVAQDELPIL